MRVGLARLFAFVAIIEGAISVPLKLTDSTFLGISGGGFLKAATATLVLGIFLLLDDFRDRYEREHVS